MIRIKYPDPLLTARHKIGCRVNQSCVEETKLTVDRLPNLNAALQALIKYIGRLPHPQYRLFMLCLLRFEDIQGRDSVGYWKMDKIQHIWLNI